VRGIVARCVVCAVIAMPSVAFAGRSFYGWLYGTDVLPERGVELGTWVQEENGQGNNPGPANETRWWEAVEVGITDQLEVVFPLEIAWDQGVNGNADAQFTSFDRFGIDARYRFVTSDPVHAPALVPLLRVAVMQDIRLGGTIMEADAVASYNVGRFQAAVDLGLYGEAGLGSANDVFELHPSAGISIAVVEQLRLGAEVHAEHAFDPTSNTWVAVGPNLAWTHGRFWLSAAYGFGVTGITDAPRVQWGVAF
jgi:hypothetical protein